MTISTWKIVLFGVLWVLCGSPALARAEGTSLAELQAELSLHRSLLNKQLLLPSLSSYSAATRTWHPLPTKPPRVRVLSVWSLPCQPCIDELPMLTEMAAKWRRQSADVQFLFLADPPEHNPQPALEEFWLHPNVARLAERCSAERLGTRFEVDRGPVCLLDLHRAELVRSPAADGKLPLSMEIRPLTLLIDESGVVRDVFLGSLKQRPSLLERAIQNLLEATRVSASRRGPGRF